MYLMDSVYCAHFSRGKYFYWFIINTRASPFSLEQSTRFTPIIIVSNARNDIKFIYGIYQRNYLHVFRTKTYRRVYIEHGCAAKSLFAEFDVCRSSAVLLKVRVESTNNNLIRNHNSMKIFDQGRVVKICELIGKLIGELIRELIGTCPRTHTHTHTHELKNR